jgi:hypothetical protein
MKLYDYFSLLSESGLMGSNFPIQTFSIQPKYPHNLKDLANYIIMLYKILYGKNNGLQNYTNEKLKINFFWEGKRYVLKKQNIKGNAAKQNKAKFLNFLNLTNLLIKYGTLSNQNIAPSNNPNEKKNINSLKKANLFINNKNNNEFFNIDDEFFRNEIIKKFKIEILISNTDTKKPVKVSINPWNISASSSWNINVLHDLFHIIINPSTVSKFNRGELGSFTMPIGYTHEELLQEISALMTDVNKTKFQNLNINKNTKEYKSRYNQKPIDYVETPPVMFTFFLNILRNTIVFNYMKTLSSKELQKFQKNPGAAVSQLLSKDSTVKFDDVLEYFNDYPDFQKILIKMRKMLINKKQKVAELNKQIKEYQEGGDENKEDKARTLKFRYNRVISDIDNNDDFTTFKYIKNPESDYYEGIDRIIFSFMQKSSKFLTKKGQEVGASELKITNFSKYVDDCVMKYNKTVMEPLSFFQMDN